MGRVRTKTVKKAAKVLIEKYYTKVTADFHFNKKVLSEVALLPSKRMRNKIAGFATHLIKRIQKGPIRGISLKVQEEERERRLDFAPEHSKIDINKVVVSQDVREMLKRLGQGNLPGLVTESKGREQREQREGGHKRRNERKEEN